jgi:hypothetical protein
MWQYTTNLNRERATTKNRAGTRGMEVENLSDIVNFGGNLLNLYLAGGKETLDTLAAIRANLNETARLLEELNIRMRGIKLEAELRDHPENL